ncbi:SigE family RNA polymerase sigma factor [Actinomadura gamaensis]|uniref:SigE family RNA polymerase sigma factor n=1 Tax=Actinomadura gamaensis TaxID=1763541 RepID=A0ABV9U9B3_9ACTN
MSTREARGTADTFEEFVNATAGRLLRTAVFLVYDRHLAEDLLQVAYERVAKRWRRLADGDPEAYARRVLVNLAIDESKRRARRRDLPAGSVADLDRIAGRAPQPGGPPGDGELEEALRALPAQQRAVVVLRYWCDLGEREIADTLGISRGTVKSHTARAMTALRAHVREGRTHGR